MRSRPSAQLSGSIVGVAAESIDIDEVLSLSVPHLDDEDRLLRVPLLAALLVMRCPVGLLPIGSFVVLLVAGCGPGEPPPEPDPTEVEIAEHEVVLHARLEGYAQPTFLDFQIAEDGRFRVQVEESQRAYFARAGGQLRYPAAAVALLDALAELGFFELDKDAILEAMRASPNENPGGIHVGLWLVEVEWQGQRNSVDLRFCEYFAPHYPDVAQLQVAAECSALVRAFLDEYCTHAMLPRAP